MSYLRLLRQMHYQAAKTHMAPDGHVIVDVPFMCYQSSHLLILISGIQWGAQARI